MVIAIFFRKIRIFGGEKAGMSGKDLFLQKLPWDTSSVSEEAGLGCWFCVPEEPGFGCWLPVPEEAGLDYWLHLSEAGETPGDL